MAERVSLGTSVETFLETSVPTSVERPFRMSPETSVQKFIEMDVFANISGDLRI